METIFGLVVHGLGGFFLLSTVVGLLLMAHKELSKGEQNWLIIFSALAGMCLLF